LSENTHISHLVEHLFRHEAGKMVSVLTRIFGPGNLELAEDVVQDTLIEAMHQWAYKGLPDNPSQWLIKVAKNKALNILKHEKHKRIYAESLQRISEVDWTTEDLSDNFFSEQHILDDQLRMIFTCCHPAISTDSQIALALRTLCGFSTQEIANAFLTSEENIHKRLVRARQKIRDDKIPFEVPIGKELIKRLGTVLETIYLLFNEGYSASKGEALIRYELCEEAMRLGEIIRLHPLMDEQPEVYALLALMQLNASRFQSRIDEDGQLVTMADQNRALWDRDLIAKGMANLERSKANHRVSMYCILAMISAYHCSAPHFEATDWQGILSMYDNLAVINRSPLVLLNRTIALSKVNGPEIALKELERLHNIPALQTYYLFYSTAAEFLMESGDFEKARENLKTAIEYTDIPSEKEFLHKRLNQCQKNIF